jgi:hypothetical protein
MPRRGDRRRRAARRGRVVSTPPPSHTEEPFDRDAALARWKQKLATMTARGFMGPVWSVSAVTADSSKL